MTGQLTKREVSIEVDEEKHHGEYTISDGMIEVGYRGRRKCTQLGGHEQYPESLAMTLLREMVLGMPD